MNVDVGNDNVEQPATPRALLRLVYIMGIVLVLLFLALIGGIVWKSTRAKPLAKPEDFSMGLGLKAGDVKSVDLDGGHLAITTAGELIVIDVAKKKLLLREPLAP
jgi:hypothetical protein